MIFLSIFFSFYIDLKKINYPILTKILSIGESVKVEQGTKDPI
jgi:hypothetical protein